MLLASLLTAQAQSGPSEQSPARAPRPAWKAAAGWSLRTAYDSNVFLQDQKPAPAIDGAFEAARGSLVATGAAVASASLLTPANVKVLASYSPEATVFLSARTEDHQTHRISLGSSGGSQTFSWGLQNNATWISGNGASPVFGGLGGVPALGGIPLRDRRDAFSCRSNLGLTYRTNRWFARPAATFYYHDFRTAQSRRAGYENYIDRQEWSAGFDVGRQVADARFYAGVRRGRQDQLRLLGVDSPYDSTYWRWLAGLEGSPAGWMHCSVATGPETHRFPAATPAGFNRDKTYWWIDGSATLTAGPRDTCTLTVRRFLQPAFSSASVYEDITYEATWRRRMHERLTVGAGFRAYGGDWPGPATREDWIFTPSVQLQFTPAPRHSLDVAWSLDRAESRLPLTAGREFRRHLVSVAYRISP